MTHIIAALSLVALAAPPAAAAAHPAAASRAPLSSIVAVHGRLRVAGNRVVGAGGKPITLRGLSLFWSQWKPAFYNAAAIDWVVTDWHATVVRAAIAAAGPGSYETDPDAQLHRAETAIDAAVAAGIYVIVDWHAHDPRPEAAQRFFAAIARRYRGVPNLIYETWNEPRPRYGWADVIKPYHVRVIGAIRAIDPDAFVVAGTRSWSQDVDEAAADPLPFANTAYTLHFYAATHKGELRRKADTALSRGAALFVTEFGTTAADGDAPIDAAETRRWWQWCDARGISYVNWSLADKAEASAVLKPGADPRGGWPVTQLTASGTLVRHQLRLAPRP
jgi:endoglucanase